MFSQARTFQRKRAGATKAKGACGVPAVVAKTQEGQGAGAVSQMQKSGWSQRDLHLMGPQQRYITFLNLSYFDI